jgi:hypothetical protein
MVKAKEFWDYLCNDLSYRFFAGVPCIEFKNLYNAMSSKIMHYIPAVDINTALGIASGVSITSINTGIKSGIVFHSRELYNLIANYNNFNILYEIPVLFIMYSNIDDFKILSSNKISYVILDDNFKNKLNRVIKKMEKEQKPCVLVVKEGIFE